MASPTGVCGAGHRCCFVRPALLDIRQRRAASVAALRARADSVLARVHAPAHRRTDSESCASPGTPSGRLSNVEDERLDPERLEGLMIIGVDEISYLRHHHYMMLRQQLAVLRRTTPRPRLKRSDRC